MNMPTWQHANPILDQQLFLGDIVAATASRALTERRITHILSVCRESIPAEHANSNIIHMRIDIDDVPHADLLIWMPQAVRFIDDALSRGGIVLVHGSQGISRSATIVAAYLMAKHGMSSAQALDVIRRKREQVWPNAGFHQQLVLFGQCGYNPTPRHPVYQSFRAALQPYM